MDREVCPRHSELADNVKEMDRRLRIVESLQLAHNEKFVSLYNKMDDMQEGFRDLKKTILGGMGTTIVILLGFILWYIKSLGGS